MSELAARLDIARRSATSVVDELVERGLVERHADPADRRAVAVVVTQLASACSTSCAPDAEPRRRLSPPGCPSRS